PKNPDRIVLKNRTAKTKTGLSGPKNSDRKAPKQADHGPKISDTYSYQVGGDPCVEGKDTSLSPMCWATPRMIEVSDPPWKRVIQAFWRSEFPFANFSRTLKKSSRICRKAANGCEQAEAVGAASHEDMIGRRCERVATTSN